MGAYRVVAHREDPAGGFERLDDGGVSLGEPLAVVEAPGAFEPDRQILVSEVEPHVDRQALQALHHVERVAGETPSAFVDPIRQPECDQVGVRRNVRAVDLDVVAGVRDHGQRVAADDVEHSAGELRAAGAAG